ncbi:hypothetical protein F5B20DRAFT_583283 [Whalleya microplaca]|nr:hypothetical protein F5B20DRAFT_583283 [Whalleya microplaca]
MAVAVATSWDDQLLQQDFVSSNWRTFQWDAVPMRSVSISTLTELSRRCAQYDEINGIEPELSPPDWERFRRVSVRDDPATTSEQVDETILQLFIPDRDGDEPMPDAGPLPNDTSNNELEKAFTLGFELELPVAVCLPPAQGLFSTDPHPTDNRWLLNEVFANDEWAAARCKEAVVAQFCRLLTEQTDLIVAPRDEDEDETLYRMNLRKLHRLEAGLEPMSDPPDDSPSRAPAPMSESSKNVARQAAIFATNFFGPGSPLQLATDNDLDRVLGMMPSLAQWGVVTASEQNAIGQRLRLLLRLARLQTRRDSIHVSLPGMKDRYKHTSVYTIPGWGLASVTRNDYEDLQGTPAGPGVLVNPTHAYHWEVVKVASPVMRAQPEETRRVLLQIMKALRNNFRIHKDMRAIPVTTQAVVSHTAGFSILELKKFITLWGCINNEMNHLCREYRSSPDYNLVCGEMLRFSPLGAASYAPTDLVDTWVGSGIVPRPSDDERHALLAEMFAHIPLDAAWNPMSEPGKRFLIGVWLFTKVDDLARAINVDQSQGNTDVAIKVAGDGPHTADVADDDDEILLPGEVGKRPQAFREIDPVRGVIEFRKCHGSMDPKHVMCWMYLCAYVVHTVKTSNPEQFKQMLARIAAGGPSVSVLGELGVPIGIQEYFRDHIHEAGGFFEPDDNDRRVTWADPFYSRVDWAS